MHCSLNWSVRTLALFFAGSFIFLQCIIDRYAIILYILIKILGLTAVRPEDISLPTTATDLEQDTVMLSGAIIMENGCNIRNGYPMDLDSLRAGARIGMLLLYIICLHIWFFLYFHS